MKKFLLILLSGTSLVYGAPVFEEENMMGTQTCVTSSSRTDMSFVLQKGLLKKKFLSFSPDRLDQIKAKNAIVLGTVKITHPDDGGKEVIEEINLNRLHILMFCLEKLDDGDDILQAFLWKALKGPITSKLDLSDELSVAGLNREDYLKRYLDKGKPWAFYESALACEVDDPQIARQFYIKAANLGHGDAIKKVNLLMGYSGKSLIDRDEIKKWKKSDYAVALYDLYKINRDTSFLKRSADLEYPLALYCYALICDEREDFKEALNYYVRFLNLGLNGEEKKNAVERFSYISCTLYNPDKWLELPDSALKVCHELIESEHYEILLANISVLYFARKDMDKSLELFEKLLETERPEAYHNMGNFWQETKNYEKAIHYYQKAAEKGWPASAYNLGSIYYSGVSSEGENPEIALKYFNNAADKGFPLSENIMGVFYYLGKNVKQSYKNAFSYFKKSAEKGYATAEYNLGILYFLGKGCKQDYKTARSYFLSAAKKGHRIAQYNMGTIYSGNFNRKYKGEIDMKKAFEYYDLAAKQGYCLAQYVLGCMYVEGGDVKKDWNKAEQYFLDAAAQDYGPAVIGLVHIYLTTGKFEDAAFWLDRANRLEEPLAHHYELLLQEASRDFAGGASSDSVNKIMNDTFVAPEVFEDIGDIDPSAFLSIQSEMPEIQDQNQNDTDDWDDSTVVVGDENDDSLVSWEGFAQKAKDAHFFFQQVKELDKTRHKIKSENVLEPNKKSQDTINIIRDETGTKQQKKITKELLDNLAMDPFFAGKLIIKKSDKGYKVFMHFPSPSTRLVILSTHRSHDGLADKKFILKLKEHLMELVSALEKKYQSDK